MADNGKLEESINYLDGNYGTIAADPNNSASKLRSRPTSFNSIFNQWRKNIMTSLADYQADLVEAEYPVDEDGKIMEEAEKEMDRIITSIAGIENIIVNDLDKVPSNYIGKKAIKLKEEMISQLKEKSKGIYAVPQANANEVFENAKVEDADGNKLGFSLEDTKEELASMGPVEDEIKVETEVEAAEPISHEDVEAVVDNELSKVAPAEEDGVLTAEEVADVVDQAFDDQKVFKNAGAAARVDEFDADGNRKSYSEIEDEVRRAREKAQFEEYERNNGPEEDVVAKYLELDLPQDDEMAKLIERYKEEQQRGQELAVERESLEEKDRNADEELAQAKQEATLGEEEYHERMRELKEALLSMETMHNEMQTSNDEIARNIELKTSDAGMFREKGRYFRDNASQISSMISEKEEERVEGKIR